jgi:NAD(P)-dependent dehydrogenase (short-subunit alcohol dehydrogenase family)
MKRALVTGGARRIGRAMALKLAARGMDVAIHYFGAEDDARQTLKDVEAMGVRAVLLEADLLDTDQLDALVGRAATGLGGPLDVLINNASIFEHDTIGSITHKSWDRHINSNLRAGVFLSQAFAAQAPKAATDVRGMPKAQAAIVNIVDQRARKLTPEFMSYTLAKMGLWAFTQTAAQAMAPHIRVNSIGPGPTIQGHRQSPSHFAAQQAATLLERGSHPDDIVQAMEFILDAPALTGQLLCIDGGQHLAWQTPDLLGVE